MPSSKPIAILRTLTEGGVEFIVVGGIAAVLDGTPVNTFDVDVVHSRDDDNIARLLPVLESLDAVFRIQPERRIRPTTTHLAGPGRLNLVTRYGPLDVLGTIGSGLGYRDLLPHSSKMDVGGGIHVRVLDLETLIALKEELGGEKDRAVLPLLRRTLAEKKASLRPPA
jgi:predicted nucleotidyltransferase